MILLFSNDTVLSSFPKEQGGFLHFANLSVSIKERLQHVVSHGRQNGAFEPLILHLDFILILKVLHQFWSNKSFAIPLIIFPLPNRPRVSSPTMGSFSASSNNPRETRCAAGGVYQTCLLTYCGYLLINVAVIGPPMDSPTRSICLSSNASSKSLS